MSSNVRDFNMALDRFADEVPKEVQKIHRAVALEGLKGVVQMTPVDTGRARANWQVTQDEPAGGEVDNLDKDGGVTIAAGQAKIGVVKPYSLTWITNNLPYIEELEGGSSTQAPQGMLNVTFSRLQGWLRGYRL